MKHGLNKAEGNQETKARGFVPTKDLWIFGGQIPPCQVLPTGAMVEWSLIAKAMQRIHNERVQGVEIARDSKPADDVSNPKDAADHRVQGSGGKQEDSASRSTRIPQPGGRVKEQAASITEWTVTGEEPHKVYAMLNRNGKPWFTLPAHQCIQIAKAHNEDLEASR